MKGYIANTDYNWYLFLSRQSALEEVNFWRPSAKSAFRATQQGTPFFFKLKKPYYKIAGFGYFEYYTHLPLREAWNLFGPSNGAPDFETMRRQIEKLRGPGADEIGCIMVLQPVFFNKSDWVDGPRDWKPNIQQGTRYDLTAGEGRRMFDECRLRAAALKMPEPAWATREASREKETTYGEPMLVRPRLGQNAFRGVVMDAYHRACAVTTEHALPVLDAAHIRPLASGGSHSIVNGLFLRTDVHTLFDLGYVTVTPQYHFEVSRRLKEEFENGKTYYALDGKMIQLPNRINERPAPALLAWHNQEVFRDR